MLTNQKTNNINKKNAIKEIRIESLSFFITRDNGGVL